MFRTLRRAWFRRFPLPFRQTPSARARSVSLHLESLEGRELLSTSVPLNPVSWTPLGPAPIQNGQTLGSQPVSGRLTGLAADPSDTTGRTIFVAAAGGGVWKTVNGGSTWAPLTDFQATLAMGAIAL